MTPPHRICSLLPSATEIVFALGLGDQLAAVTHECDFPPEAVGLPVITRSIVDHRTHSSREIHNHISSAVHGGSSIYALDQDLLERLNPDLILTQELCDVCAVSYDVVEKAVHRLEGHRPILSLEPTSVGGISSRRSSRSAQRPELGSARSRSYANLRSGWTGSPRGRKPFLLDDLRSAGDTGDAGRRVADHATNLA